MVHQCSPAGISKARDLFERALTAAGLHVAQGTQIWEAYRLYEQAILLTIHESDGQVRIFLSTFVRNILYKTLPICVSSPNNVSFLNC